MDKKDVELKIKALEKELEYYKRVFPNSSKVSELFLQLVYYKVTKCMAGFDKYNKM